jgi:hypothetical protein
MADYTVTGAEVKKEIPDGKFGPAKVIGLMLKDGQGVEKAAEWFTKAATPLPAVGSQIQGDLEPSNYGLKFKKAGGQFGGGGGGGRPRDPEDQRRIVRQHSQKIAVAYLTLRGETAPSEGRLRQLVDWFYFDAVSPPNPALRKDAERDPNPRPDVPADESDLPFGRAA